MILNICRRCASSSCCWRRSRDRPSCDRKRAYPPAGRFVDVTGGRLHVLERGKPDAPPVVLLHGASGNLQDMRLALGDRLAARYRVILIDRPGHGWSDRPGGDDDAVPARQAALIDEALRRLGVKRAIIVGHSWSGALATAYALAYPERVAGLVLLAPVTHPWPGGIAWHYRLARRRCSGRCSPARSCCRSAFLIDASAQRVRAAADARGLCARRRDPAGAAPARVPRQRARRRGAWTA